MGLSDTLVQGMTSWWEDCSLHASGCRRQPYVRYHSHTCHRWRSDNHSHTNSRQRIRLLESHMNSSRAAFTRHSCTTRVAQKLCHSWHDHDLHDRLAILSRKERSIHPPTIEPLQQLDRKHTLSMDTFKRFIQLGVENQFIAASRRKLLGYN